VTIFQLARKRRLELVALYLSCQPGRGRAGTDYQGQYATAMSREQLVAGIAATPKGARLLRGGAR
jgi:hypothetical protein